MNTENKTATLPPHKNAIAKKAHRIHPMLFMLMELFSPAQALSAIENLICDIIMTTDGWDQILKVPEGQNFAHIYSDHGLLYYWYEEILEYPTGSVSKCLRTIHLIKKIKERLGYDNSFNFAIFNTISLIALNFLADAIKKDEEGVEGLWKQWLELSMDNSGQIRRHKSYREVVLGSFETTDAKLGWWFLDHLNPQNTKPGSLEEEIHKAVWCAMTSKYLHVHKQHHLAVTVKPLIQFIEDRSNLWWGDKINQETIQGCEQAVRDQITFTQDLSELDEYIRSFNLPLALEEKNSYIVDRSRRIVRRIHLWIDQSKLSGPLLEQEQVVRRAADRIGDAFVQWGRSKNIRWDSWPVRVQGSIAHKSKSKEIDYLPKVMPA